MTGTMKLHIINLDALNGDITENVDGKYIHLLKPPLTLQSGGFSQGFDFYDEEDYDGNPEGVTKYWKKLLDRWLDREYLADGEGGFTTSRRCRSYEECLFHI